MKKQTIAAIIFASLSSLAIAEEATVIPFNDLDMNQDDALSSDEVSAMPGITEQWKDLDADGNGLLTRGEYAGYNTPAPAAGTDTSDAK